MNLYLSSTREQPLLFFKTFLNKGSLKAFEEDFYQKPVNPSQSKNISQGYIEYQKDFYLNDEHPTTKIYFRNHLSQKLEFQCEISLSFLTERKITKEYNDNLKNGFINQRIVELRQIIDKSGSLRHKDIIYPVLITLLDKLPSFLYAENRKTSADNNRRQTKTTYPFFGNHQRTSAFRLKKLYVELLDIGLIDEEEVSEECFLNVFISPNPAITGDIIKFNQDNYHAIYFFECLKPYFSDFSPSQIDKSRSFKSKGNTIFSQSLLDTSKSRFKERDKTKYQKIKEAVSKAMPSIS